MKNNHISEEMLWRYVDNDLSVQEKLLVDHHIKQSEESRALLEEIQAFNAELKDTVVEAPSMRFAKNVMEFIEEEVSIVEYRPLFRTIWKKMFASSIAAIVLGLVGFALMVQNVEGAWVGTMNENITFLESAISGWASSTFGIIVILSALWVLFVFDKLFLSKRFS